MEEKKLKFYERTWFLWVMLIFLPVIGIILLWTVHKDKKTATKVILTVIFALWFFILLGMNQGKSRSDTASVPSAEKSTEDGSQATAVTSVAGTSEISSAAEVSEISPAAEVSEISSAAETAEGGVNMTSGQSNALRKAQQYLSFTPFSHDGLAEQLEFDQFAEEDAEYAADNCGADWNEQALKKAQNYISMTAFSHSGLEEQLEYDKFTKDQASYGADNCGADWTEQAGLKAQSYLKIQAFSKGALIDQLVYDGFTREEAEAGVTAAGL